MEKEYTTISEALSRIENRIIQSQLSQKKVLTFREAAVFTGRSLSNLYKLTSANKIPHSKPEGKLVYFDREELEQWMLRNPVKTAAAIETEAATRVTLTSLSKKGGKSRA